MPQGQDHCLRGYHVGVPPCGPHTHTHRFPPGSFCSLSLSLSLSLSRSLSLAVQLLGCTGTNLHDRLICPRSVVFRHTFWRGKCCPNIFTAIFREFVRRFFPEGGGRQKNLVFPGIFQCCVFVTYCFRYYIALSLLLFVPFFPRKTRFILPTILFFEAFCYVTCTRIFAVAFRVGPRFTYAHLWIVWNVLLIVVLEGEMLPEFFAAVFREFLRLFFAENRFGRKI